MMDGSAYRLRPAVNADAAAVRALVFGVLGEYGLSPDPTGTDADLFDLEASYGGSGGWFVVLTTAAGEVVGSAGLLPTARGDVELRKMYLARGHRGLGLGRRLLEAALGEARARRFPRVTLETASVLGEALRLYARYGFRRLAECPHAGRCDVVMVLELAGEAAGADLSCGPGSF